jgi:ABC-type glutathione transport system ATPase component
MAPLLELARVSKTFGGLLRRRRVAAVRDVSFTLAGSRPEVFTLLGQSGSGKTTLARMVLGLERPTAGSLRLDGEDIARLRRGSARRRLLRLVQPIFQNPFEAFNPLRQVDHYLLLTARRFGGAGDRPGPEALTDAALRQVGLSLAEVAGRYPHELSGGQLQRLAIARALLAKPRLLVADEPVSMVDASLRMAIVNLFKTLKNELNISILYITHDLATAYLVSDRVMIMRAGEVVECGEARQVLIEPQHPYSRQLKGAVLMPRFATPDLAASAPHLSLEVRRGG